jgi:hypothetical protein
MVVFSPNSILVFSFLGFFLAEIAIMFFIFYKEILSFFFPDDWIYVIMIMKDTSIKTMFVKVKGKSDFVFKGGIYVWGKKGVHKKSKLNCYFYKEGVSQPIELEDLKVLYDSELLKGWKAQNIRDMLSEGRSILTDILPFVFIGVVIGFILGVVLLKSNLVAI